MLITGMASDIGGPLLNSSSVTAARSRGLFRGGFARLMFSWINIGKLRAIGYVPDERMLRVEFGDGTAIDYSGVGTEVWRKFLNSGDREE